MTKKFIELIFEFVVCIVLLFYNYGDWMKGNFKARIVFVSLISGVLLKADMEMVDAHYTHHVYDLRLRLLFTVFLII